MSLLHTQPSRTQNERYKDSTGTAVFILEYEYMAHIYVPNIRSVQIVLNIINGFV